MELLDHIYWKQKREFALPSDRYEAWVVFAVEEGVFRYEIGEHAGEAGFADLVVCPPEVLFVRETVTPLTFHYIRFAADGGSPLPPGLLHLNDTKRLSSNYAYLRQLAEDSSPSARAWKNHLVADLWQLYHMENREAAGPGKFTEDALMAEAAAAIAAQAWTPLSLLDTARSLGLSPVQLTRRFREAFGETPSAYLKSLRLAKARTLLKDSGLTLAQIAERCGYENGFYLSRVFTDASGISPAEYRKRHRV
ncbi:AraC family transcriptional regulator [Paenibacillus sp. S150]|uniref:AraC family transcriptional regulator n=1 Tax=Paenibacillus sp. S150 TaxID=2749826 RepID=UPI001C585B49|nr:AraC family transcriptional regulator [Paenibacillus sp. S150]MBW4084974.1 helix-turn-helix transcriptional regulator [Paenibacillus sp. S150]